MKILNQKLISGKLYKAYEIVYPYYPDYNNLQKHLIIPTTILIGTMDETKFINFPMNEPVMYIQEETWTNNKIFDVIDKVKMHKVLWKNMIGYMTEHTLFEEIKNEKPQKRQKHG